MFFFEIFEYFLRLTLHILSIKTPPVESIFKGPVR